MYIHIYLTSCLETCGCIVHTEYYVQRFCVCAYKCYRNTKYEMLQIFGELPHMLMHTQVYISLKLTKCLLYMCVRSIHMYIIYVICAYHKLMHTQVYISLKLTKCLLHTHTHTLVACHVMYIPDGSFGSTEPQQTLTILFMVTHTLMQNLHVKMRFLNDCLQACNILRIYMQCICESL